MPSGAQQGAATGQAAATERLNVIEQLLTDTRGVVADPFAGSGTTALAAKRLGRRCIAVEIEERYCEIAARRLAQGVLDFGSVS